MNLLAFIVEIVKAVAWPIAALVLGLAFRSEIRSLIGKMKKGKLGPAEFEFEQAVAAIKQDAPAPIGAEKPSMSNATIEFAASEPRAAILNAWLEVQREVERLSQIPVADPGPKSVASYSLRVLHRELRNQPEYIDMYNELKQLRNQAVHDTDFRPRPESVINYIELSRRLVEVLRRLPNATPRSTGPATASAVSPS
jgi:hypothetical protein